MVSSMLVGGRRRGDLETEEQQGTEAEAFLSPDVTVSGAPLPPLSGGAPDSSVGIVAPEIASADFSGVPGSIQHDGTPKLIDRFGASALAGRIAEELGLPAPAVTQRLSAGRQGA